MTTLYNRRAGRSIFSQSIVFSLQDTAFSLQSSDFRNHSLPILILPLLYFPQMGSFGKTALSGQISGFSPQEKWVRLGALEAHK